MNPFQKEIFYLYAVAKNVEPSCVGFGIIELRNKDIDIYLSIPKMPNTKNSKGKIYLCTKDSQNLIGETELKNGKCEYTRKWTIQDLYNREMLAGAKTQIEVLCEECQIVGELPQLNYLGETEYYERIQPEKMDEMRHNSVWKQIEKQYQILHPYGDDRTYVTLTIKDLDILKSPYQSMANNSFLLHGYFYYKYLILGKEIDDKYYLGVPGIFHEREKMMALMFGFEAFDCPGGEPSIGTFGYYLKSVELKE